MFSNFCDFSSAVSGILKGWDQLLNLVLDEAVEQIRGSLQIIYCIDIQQLYSDLCKDVAVSDSGFLLSHNVVIWL